ENYEQRRRPGVARRDHRSHRFDGRATWPDDRDAGQVDARRAPAGDDGPAHIAAADEPHAVEHAPRHEPGTGHRKGLDSCLRRSAIIGHASPCVSISAAAIASPGDLPPHSTNWKTG